MDNTKVPIGIYPEFIDRGNYLNARNVAISGAIQRYTAAKRDIPQEWVDEYRLNLMEAYIRQNLGNSYTVEAYVSLMQKLFNETQSLQAIGIILAYVSRQRGISREQYKELLTWAARL